MTFFDRRRNPSSLELRSFAIGQAIFVAVIANAIADRHSGLRVAGFVLAIGVAGIGLIRPNLLRPIHHLWMTLLAPIGAIVSLVLLAALYFLVVTPIALCMRVLGYDALHRRRRSTVSTYWLVRPTSKDRREYFRQF